MVCKLLQLMRLYNNYYNWCRWDSLNNAFRYQIKCPLNVCVLHEFCYQNMYCSKLFLLHVDYLYFYVMWKIDNLVVRNFCFCLQFKKCCCINSKMVVISKLTLNCHWVSTRKYAIDKTQQVTGLHKIQPRWSCQKSHCNGITCSNYMFFFLSHTRFEMAKLYKQQLTISSAIISL